MTNQTSNQKKASGSNELMDNFKTLVSDAEELLEDTAEKGSEKAEALRKQISSSLDKARKALSDSENALVEQGKEVLSTGEDFVRDNPFKALAMGAGLGFLVGLLMSRR